MKLSYKTQKKQKPKIRRDDTDQTVIKREEHYRTILEIIADGYYEVDLKGTLTFVNNSLTDLYLVTKDKLIGMPYKDYVAPEDVQKVFEAFNRIFRTGESTNVEFVFVRSDRSRGHAKVSGAPIMDTEGRIIGFRGIVRDITEVKKAKNDMEMALEAAESASRVKSHFLANISHEIRTPVNAIIGFSDMLLDSSMDKIQLEYVKTIKKSGEILVSLFNDILDFSKIEEKGLDFEEIVFDPELAVQDVITHLSPRIGVKPIKLESHIDDNVPVMVKGDPMRFRQVIANLLGNAIKFTESGRIDLIMEVEFEDELFYGFHICVRDTGIGISKDVLATIFDVFHQGDDSYTRKYGGTGLGLAVCRKIAQGMDGNVWVVSPATIHDRNECPGTVFHSTDNPGSEFHFQCRLKKTEIGPLQKTEHIQLNGLRALLLDDNTNSRDIFNHLLTNAGLTLADMGINHDLVYELEKAAIAGNPVDIVIMGIRPGDSRPFDHVGKLRHSESGCSGIPVIALCATGERDAKKCLEAGFNGFLPKPVHRRKLLFMIQKVVSEHRLKKIIPPVHPQPEAPVEPDRIVTQYAVREDMKHSARILVVEDNPVNQKLIQTMLIKWGYQVELAVNGKLAVEMIESSPESFDLIFMDIQMPVMDGLTATRVIREKGFTKIPIIAMTAHTLDNDREKCLKAGMNDYTPKPIKRDFVFKLIEKWVLSETSHDE